MDYYTNRESGVGYYNVQRMAEEKAVMEEAIVQDHKKIVKLEGRIVELEKYVIYLQQDITRTRKALERHIENDNAIHAIDRKEVEQKISSEANLSREKIAELQLTRAEISDLRKWMPDLRHKHKENLDNARTTDE